MPIIAIVHHVVTNLFQITALTHLACKGMHTIRTLGVREYAFFSLTNEIRARLFIAQISRKDICRGNAVVFEVNKTSLSEIFVPLLLF